MVCPKCNAHLRRVDAGERPVDDATKRYLDNAWYRTNPRTEGPMIRRYYRADLIEDAEAIAKIREENLSDVLRQALERYVARNRKLLETL